MPTRVLVIDSNDDRGDGLARRLRDAVKSCGSAQFLNPQETSPTGAFALTLVHNTDIPKVLNFLRSAQAGLIVTFSGGTVGNRIGGDRLEHGRIQRPVTRDQFPTAEELKELIDWAARGGAEPMPALVSEERQQRSDIQRDHALCLLVIGWTLKSRERAVRLGRQALAALSPRVKISAAEVPALSKEADALVGHLESLTAQPEGPSERQLKELAELAVAVEQNARESLRMSPGLDGGAQ